MVRQAPEGGAGMEEHIHRQGPDSEAVLLCRAVRLQRRGVQQVAGQELVGHEIVGHEIVGHEIGYFVVGL